MLKGRPARYGVGALVILPAMVLMVSGLTAPIGGSHVFRQTHVAANIDEYVQEGLSLRPATYNRDLPLAAFDFPLYEFLVAGACRLLPLDPLVSARVASLLCWIAALLVLDRLLLGAGIRRSTRLATLALFAWSPLVLFYFQAPMVDDLAVLLSLVSLWGYVAMALQGGGPGALAALLLGAFLSTLIKSPVYLPVFLAILWHRSRSQGVRSLLRPDTVALTLTAGLAVVCFKAWWMLVNASHDVLTPFERRQYFGTLAERFSATAWHPVLSDLLALTANPVIAVLAVAGALLWLRRARSPAASLFTAPLPPRARLHRPPGVPGGPPHPRSRAGRVRPAPRSLPRGCRRAAGTPRIARRRLRGAPEGPAGA